jgi:CubicO group peptidase (beta-lactamase class C family)
MRRLLRLAALAILVPGPGSGQTSPLARVRPADVDEVFAAYSGTASPGCQLGVLSRGEFLYKKAYGMADLEHRIPLTTASPISTGSIAKQFTAAVIAHLAREGKLSLEDPLRKHFPELPAYTSGVTINHLIRHTSGIRDYLGLIAIAGEPDDFHTSEPEFLELMVRQRSLNFEPGTQYLYSNSEYVLLAMLVRRVTSKSLRQAADEILFTPLGMKHTFFDDRPTDLIPDRVLGYSPHGSGFVLNTNASDGVVGDGAFFTTVDDFAPWDRYLSTHAKELFAGSTFNNGKPVYYGFGLTINRLFGYPMFGHGGGFKGYRAMMIKFPEQGLTVVCLCNSSAADASFLAGKVAGLYLGKEMPTVPPPAAQAAPPPLPAPAKLDAYTGTFYSADLDAAYEVRVHEGKLAFRCKHSIFEATPQGQDRFKFSNYNLQFEMDANGKARGFILNALRVWNLRFEKR